MTSLEMHRAYVLWIKEDEIVITAQKYSKTVYSVFTLYRIFFFGGNRDVYL